MKVVLKMNALAQMGVEILLKEQLFFLVLAKRLEEAIAGT